MCWRGQCVRAGLPCAPGAGQGKEGCPCGTYVWHLPYVTHTHTRTCMLLCVLCKGPATCMCVPVVWKCGGGVHVCPEVCPSGVSACVQVIWAQAVHSMPSPAGKGLGQEATPWGWVGMLGGGHLASLVPQACPVPCHPAQGPTQILGPRTPVLSHPHSQSQTNFPPPSNLPFSQALGPTLLQTCHRRAVQVGSRGSVWAGGKDTLSPPLYPTLSFGKQRAWVPRPGRLVAGQSEKQKILHNSRPLYMLATQPLIRHSLWGELTWGREAGAAKGRGRHWKARMLTPESPGRGGRGSLPLRLGLPLSAGQPSVLVTWSPRQRDTFTQTQGVRASLLPGNLHCIHWASLISRDREGKTHPLPKLPSRYLWNGDDKAGLLQVEIAGAKPSTGRPLKNVSCLSFNPRRG